MSGIEVQEVDFGISVVFGEVNKSSMLPLPNLDFRCNLAGPKEASKSAFGLHFGPQPPFISGPKGVKEG